MARVLIVDDSIYVRVLLRAVLESAGHDVAGEAADGDEALDLYEQLRPDVMLLDLAMPGRDGVETLRELHVRDPYARVVVCSAHTYRANIRDALGACPFVGKPLQPGELVDTIAQVLAAKPESASRQLTEAEVEGLLRAPVDARLVTVGDDGLPRITPSWHVWSARALFVATAPALECRSDILRSRRAVLSISDHEPPFPNRLPRLRHLEARGPAAVEAEPCYWRRRIAEKYSHASNGDGPAAPHCWDIFVLRPDQIVGTSTI